MICANTIIHAKASRAYRRAAAHMLCLIFVGSGILLSTPGRATTLLSEATTQATNVWNSLGLAAAYRFDPASVKMAYDRLSLTIPEADFNRLGNFLHLVKQSVMVNAAGYGLNLGTGELFKALSFGFDTAAALSVLYNKENPIDPNSMAGPVRRSSYNKSAIASDSLALFGGGMSALAAVPYCYTINFENVGAGAATQVMVTISIDSTIKDVNSFAMSEITWGLNKLYPNDVATNQAGPYSALAPGALVPIPAPGRALFYRFGGGQVMVLQRDASGLKFTWTFWKGWSLGVDQSGSVSFLINPIGIPSAINASSAPAQTSFAGDPASPHTTNPWTAANF